MSEGGTRLAETLFLSYLTTLEDDLLLGGEILFLGGDLVLCYCSIGWSFFLMRVFLILILFSTFLPGFSTLRKPTEFYWILSSMFEIAFDFP